MSSFILAISGSRKLTFEHVESIIVNEINHLLTLYNNIIIHVGDCKTGVDSHAQLICKKYNLQHIVFFAEWSVYGLSAGPIRNGKLLDGANKLLAIPDQYSKGTLDAIRQAKNKSIQTKIKFINI